MTNEDGGNIMTFTPEEKELLLPGKSMTWEEYLNFIKMENDGKPYGSVMSFDPEQAIANEEFLKNYLQKD